MTDVMEQTTETATVGGVSVNTTLAFSPAQFAIIKRLTAFCTAPKHARPVLENVYFSNHNGVLRLEATDSYGLGVLEFPAIKLDFTPFMVPATLINKVKLSAREVSRGFHSGAILVRYDGETISIVHEDSTYTEKLPEGQYPDVKRIVADLPDSITPMETLGLNPEFLARACKFFAGSTLKFTLAGGNPVTITSPTCFANLYLDATTYLMPVRLP